MSFFSSPSSSPRKKLKPESPTKAISQFSLAVVELLTGVKLEDILSKSKTDLLDIGVECRAAPQDLLDAVYDKLRFNLEIKPYPSALKSESLKRSFVEDVLGQIIYYVSKNSNCRFYLDHEYPMKSSNLPYEINGKIDYVIYKKIGNENVVVAVLECKKGDLDNGLNQCCVYLKHLSDKWPKRTVYAFCSNAIKWNLLSHNTETGFKLLEESPLFFTSMRDKKNKWFQEYTKPIHFIYSVLMKISEESS